MRQNSMEFVYFSHMVSHMVKNVQQSSEQEIELSEIWQQLTNTLQPFITLLLCELVTSCVVHYLLYSFSLFQILTDPYLSVLSDWTFCEHLPKGSKNKFKTLLIIIWRSSYIWGEIPPVTNLSQVPSTQHLGDYFVLYYH